MGELHFNWGGKKTKTKMLQITPLGKQKVENLDGEGPMFRILSCLAERGPCTLKELSQESGISQENCKYAIKSQLKPQGFVQVLDTGGDNKD